VTARVVVLLAGGLVVVLSLSLASDTSGLAWTTVAATLPCGAALIALGLRRRTTPTVMATLAGGMALVAVAQHVLAIGAPVPSEGGGLATIVASSAGESASTPVAIGLAALGLLHFPLLAIGTALCGLCVLAAAAFQLVLWVPGGSHLLGAGGTEPVSLAVTLMVMSLGAGVLATARLRPPPGRELGGTWAPLAASLLVVFGSVLFWQALSRAHRVNVSRLTRGAASAARSQLRGDVRGLAASLEVLAAQPADPERAWDNEAAVLARMSRGVVALGFIDDLQMRRQIVLVEGTGDVPISPTDRELLAQARDTGDPFMTAVHRRADGRSFARLVSPRRRGGVTRGFVSALISVDDLVDEALGQMLHDYDVRIEVDGVPIVTRGTMPADAAVREESRLKLPGGGEWVIALSPSRGLRRAAPTGLPEIVLTASLLLALLLGATLRLARAARGQAYEMAVEVRQRRRVEEELRAMAGDLEKRVDQRTEDLRRANAAMNFENALRQYAQEGLARSNEDLRQFAAFVSHELRQPLSTIGIWAELLETSGPSLTTDQGRSVAKIRAAVSRMARLIEGELALAQVTQGEAPTEEIDLAHLVTDVCADMGPILQEAGARVETGTLGHVTADPQQLRLMIRNLIENAVKYRREGAPSVVHVSERNPADAQICEIVVRDNGRGFDPADADRLFAIFRRADEGGVHGAGIGLAICRRIVERHGGTIAATGEPGVGATFIIRLPREGQEVATVLGLGEPVAGAAGR
jgi:signal transduction histidine kinase